ncbi:MAG: hypothetical protein JSU78_01280 [Deltaproteobacteria bacterium]|nr:MAG: hypothetical protein JSU78_01280 [Deltaproteobacteria bacterium]
MNITNFSIFQKLIYFYIYRSKPLRLKRPFQQAGFMEMVADPVEIGRKLKEISKGMGRT